MTVHRFYVPPEQITSAQVRVTGDDAAQIRRVLRLQPGAILQVFDGSGRQVEARITEVGASEVTAEILGVTHPQTETSAPVRLIQALLKGEKTDWAVEKATELGAASIVFFPARRSVAQVREERTERKVQRWSRIAKEAAEQCGRVKVPEVRLVPSLAAALEGIRDSRLWIADEAHARETALAGPEAPGTTAPVGEAVALLVGPEGGWTTEERERAAKTGARPLSLGPRILRAETAAVVVLSRFTCGVGGGGGVPGD